MIVDWGGAASETGGTPLINWSGGFGGGTAGGLPVIPPVQPSVVSPFELPIYLAEITAYDPTLGATRVLRYSTGTGYKHRTAPEFYAPRIIQPANFRRDAFAERQIGGRSSIGFGEIILANLDGALDSLIDLGFDGRPFVLRIGNQNGAYTDFTTVLSGTMQFAAFDWDRIRLRIRDRQVELDKPLLQNIYAGTNALPSGLEGTAENIKGQRKLRSFGISFNFAPIWVNTSLLIWQVSDGLVADVPVVRDRGAVLAKEQDYVSVSEMETVQPSPGAYRAFKSVDGSYFRLGALPIGEITCDVIEGQSVSERISASIIRRIATSLGGISSADIFEDDFTILSAASAAPIGFTFYGEITFAEALDTACASVGASWGFDHVGRFRVTQLKAPSGPPVVTFKHFTIETAAAAQDGDVLAIARLSTEDNFGNLPSWRNSVRYKFNHQVLGNDIAGSLTASERALLQEEWRTVVVEDASIKTKHLLAREIESETHFADEADANAEGLRRLTLFSVRRELLRLRVKLSNEIAVNVDLNSTVALDLTWPAGTPRFGYSGKLFTVVGIEYDAANFLAILDLWG